MWSISIFILPVLRHIPPSFVLPKLLRRYLVDQQRNQRPPLIQSQREGISEIRMGIHRYNLQQELESLESPFQIVSMVLGQRVTTMATEVNTTFVSFFPHSRGKNHSICMLTVGRMFSSRQNFSTDTRKRRRANELSRQLDCHCKMGFQTQRCKRW